MSLFKGIDKVQVSGSGRYVTPGNYVLEVAEVKTFESQKKKGRHFFCVEGVVLSTTAQEYVPGDMVSWLVNITDHESALSNIKNFTMSLSPDMTEADVTPGSVDAMCSADQPASGTKVRATAINVQTRSGGDFTKVSWAPYNEA